MSNMQKDGISGHVSDYIERNDIIDVRPDDHPYVRVTHFPYDGNHVDPASDDFQMIPLGNAYEVTVWDGRHSIRDAYMAQNGAEAACEQAQDIAQDEGGIPIWDTIVCLRPRIELVEQTPMETIQGDYTTTVMETDRVMAEDGEPTSWWIAVDRESRLAGSGTTKDEALNTLEQTTTAYDDCDDARTGEIVEPDGTSRVAGSPIRVEQIVRRNDRVDSLPELVAMFSDPLTMDEAQTALDWAGANPEKVPGVPQEMIERLQDDLRNTFDLDFDGE